MPRYNKNFITEAILRIDFAAPIVELTSAVNEELDRFILRFFPQKESKNSFSEELIINPNSNVVDRKKTEFKEWNYYANDKNKRLCLTRDFVFISFKQYISYEDFTENFLEILKKLSRTYVEFACKRFGMRYINNIRTEGNATDWNEYINDSMTSVFNIKPENSYFTRVFQIMEYSNQDIKTKFQFGMHNPDYPAIIRQKVFVLDMDSYKVGRMSMEDIEEVTSETHQLIESLFEMSIKKPLRDLLNE